MAKDSFELQAESRTDLGKAASRRLRRTQDYVPATVYGADKAPQSIMLKHNIINKALKNEAVFSHILTLCVDNKKEKVVLKNLQRHSYKPKVTHLDFQRISAKEKLTMQVPLHFLNEEDAPGVKAGGVVTHLITEVEIRCLPSDLPEFIAMDLSKLELDHSLHFSDIKLPNGVEFAQAEIDSEHDQAIVSISIPKEIPEEEEEEAAAAESAEEEAEGEKTDENAEKETPSDEQASS